jgi:diaminohydroxyphosphoribosylaminopyrimidine deaminase/5-amino-6-(5-phosphoribosylamino)uracil reductase
MIMNKFDYMKRAIELAEQGKGKVNPNPLVGAVIVKDGKIIGEGYHECFGHAHAEVNAFLNATEDVEGADMYVTLEPCSHYGKTPPCALKIIEKKIHRVFISSLDPNPLVNHKGVELLEQAGITVESGILESETQKQNEIFLKYIQTKKPFVAIKYAMTLDGKIATPSGDSKWITNEKSRAFVHDLRNQYMAIMVGVNTIIKDNPRLDTRREGVSRNPIRFIIDPNLRIPEHSIVVETAQEQQTYLVTGQTFDPDKKDRLVQKNVRFIHQNTVHDIDFSMLIQEIAKLHIDSLLIEGGASVLGSAIESRIVDKVYAFIAPKIIGGKDAPSPIGGLGIFKMNEGLTLKDITLHTFDHDIMVEGYLTDNKEQAL